MKKAKKITPVDKAKGPDVPYNKWDDAEFVAEVDRRVKALKDGTDKGTTWEEVKERVRKRHLDSPKLLH